MEEREWIGGGGVEGWGGSGEFFSWILERENNATCILVPVKRNRSSGQC